MQNYANPLTFSMDFSIFSISNTKIKESDMKFIIAILLLTVGSFARNTTYKDGTDCKCDSIHTTYYAGGIGYSSSFVETPYVNDYKHGIAIMYAKDKDSSYYVQGKYNYEFGASNGNSYEYFSNGGIRKIYTDVYGIRTLITDGYGNVLYRKSISIDTAYWYNSYTSKYCIVSVTTPSDFVYTEVGYCENNIPVNKLNEVSRALKIKACKENFKKNNKHNIYEYLAKCIGYSVIEYDSPSVSYTLCGIGTINTDGNTAHRPNSCNYSSSWWRTRK